MEKVDYSTNSKKITDLYTKVVRGDSETSYGVFTVDKSNVLDATASGPGDLTDFVEEFNDGEVQFGLARVTVPGSDVYKNILLGWCPDNAPARLRLSFAPTFAEIARIFSGYHIQITARDSDDLDVDEMLSRVGAAAGARYTYHAVAKPTSKPAASTLTKTQIPTPAINKPPFKNSSPQPKVLGNVVSPPRPLPVFPAKAGIAAKTSSSDDGWGDEKAIEERDFETQPLEDVPSAYKPTKVNIEELRGQKSDTISSHPKDSLPIKAENENKITEPEPLGEKKKYYQSNDNERLTSLPKPKISNSVSGRYTASNNGAPSVVKPVFGSKPIGSVAPSQKELPGGVFQNHANENGLSPAQAWAQKRGKYAVDALSKESEVEDAFSKLSTNENKQVESNTVLPSLETRNSSLLKGNENVDHASKTTPLNDIKSNPVRPVVASEELKHPAVSSTYIESDQESTKSEEVEEHTTEVTKVTNVQLEVENSELNLPLSISAVAEYDYKKDEDNEVSFEKDDIIIDIEFVDEGWWWGKNSRTGDLGVFPGSYVSLKDQTGGKANAQAASAVSSEQHTQQQTKSSGKTAIAEYDYKKEEDNEITFSQGDLIVDIEFVEEDWWSGRNSVTGEVGVFPGNFVALQ